MSIISDTVGKPIRCKAAVGREAGQPYQIEDIIVAPPKAYEVRIKIICTAVCHSDLTMWQDENFNFPTIFGHEAVGKVESVGENVTDVSPNDYVVTNWLAVCGECVDCKSENSNLCSNFPFNIETGMPRDGTSRFSNDNGETINHFIYVSSFSEYTVVDITNLTKIDINIIRPSLACLLSCGVSTGLGAAWKVANIEKGKTVVVFGLGTVGCAVVEAARRSEAARIIGVDVVPEKKDYGKQFGMTDFINPNDYPDKSVSEVINAMTDDGLGADYCFQCSVGKEEVTYEAYACCRKAWGKLIITDGFHSGSTLTFDSTKILFNGNIFRGTLYGGNKHKYDIPKLVELWLNKGLELDGFVTNELDFEDINKAVDMMLNAKGLRCIIWMDKSNNEKKN